VICVRDHASYELLRAIGVRKPVQLTADLVFALDAGSPSPIRTAQPAALVAVARGRRHPRVVVIPRYSLTAAQQSAIALACDHLVDAYGARIIFMPFQTGYLPRFDDLAAIAGIQGGMRQAAASEVFLTEDPRNALACIGSADLVLSARLHGLIFAALGAVPLVALDYEVKVGSFMHEIGQHWASLSLPDLDAGRLPALLDRAWDERAATPPVLRAHVCALRDNAERNFTTAAEVLDRPRAPGLLTASALLLISTTLVNAGNYLFNVLLGRALGPAAFADVSVIVTLMLVLSFLTSAIGQTTRSSPPSTTPMAICGSWRPCVPGSGAPRCWWGRRRWPRSVWALPCCRASSTPPRSGPS